MSEYETDTLTAKQIFPAFQVGCPGFILPVATFDGSTCISTPPTVKGGSFAVTFPEPGNFKLVCLVHPHMTGVIHVLETSAILPHDQTRTAITTAMTKQRTCSPYASSRAETA